MQIHIIGVGTTFMSGLALLARRAGHDVTGSDSCIIPKIRQQLEAEGIQLKTPFKPENLAHKPDLVIVGNDLHPENAELLELRKRAIPSISGASWLEDFVLHDKSTKDSPPSNPDANIQKDDVGKFTKHAPKIPIAHEFTKHAPKPPDENEPAKQRHKPPPAEAGAKSKRIIH